MHKVKIKPFLIGGHTHPRYGFASNLDQYLICISGYIVVGCTRRETGFEVNLYALKMYITR